MLLILQVAGGVILGVFVVLFLIAVQSYRQ